MFSKFLAGAARVSPLHFLVLVCLCLTSIATQAQDDYAGFRVVGRHLYDATGEKVVLVGVNKMVIWTDIDGVPAFEEIAKTGANAVRIVWLTSGTAEQLDTAITNAIRQQLIPVVDCHDTTGDWSKLGACVDYWIRYDIQAIIRKHERYLLINIANEADDGQLRDIEYKAGYELAIRKMRAFNIRVPLIIDGQSYASRIDNLQKNAPYLMRVDPLHNVMFSIHLYWPSQRFGAQVDELVIKELRESAEMELPLIVGEFAYEAVGCVGEIPYRTIIEQAHLNEIGWFAWEWGPGNTDCSSLDMTDDGTFATLHAWGLEVAVTDPYSIRNVAVRPQSMLNVEVTEFRRVPETAPTTPWLGPDLVITDISWTPEVPVRGDDVVFTATIENQGDVATVIEQSFSVSFTINGEPLTCCLWVNTTLAPGESILAIGGGQYNANIWEDAPPGEFIAFAWVDPFDDPNVAYVAEDNEYNNMLTEFGAVRLSAP